MRIDSGRVARPAAIQRSGQGGAMGSDACDSQRLGIRFMEAGSRPTRPFQAIRLTTNFAGASRATASAKPTAWFSMPTRPSETVQMVSGSATKVRTLAVRRLRVRAKRDPRQKKTSS